MSPPSREFLHRGARSRRIPTQARPRFPRPSHRTGRFPEKRKRSRLQGPTPSRSPHRMNPPRRHQVPGGNPTRSDPSFKPVPNRMTKGNLDSVMMKSTGVPIRSLRSVNRPLKTHNRLHPSQSQPASREIRLPQCLSPLPKRHRRPLLLEWVTLSPAFRKTHPGLKNQRTPHPSSDRIKRKRLRPKWSWGRRQASRRPRNQLRRRSQSHPERSTIHSTAPNHFRLVIRPRKPGTNPPRPGSPGPIPRGRPFSPTKNRLKPGFNRVRLPNPNRIPSNPNPYHSKKPLRARLPDGSRQSHFPDPQDLH